jgi:hypothetical protein
MQNVEMAEIVDVYWGVTQRALSGGTDCSRAPCLGCGDLRQNPLGPALALHLKDSLGTNIWNLTNTLLISSGLPRSARASEMELEYFRRSNGA